MFSIVPSGFVKVLIILAGNPFHGITLLGPDAGVLLVELVLLSVYPYLIADFDGWIGSIVKCVVG